jgi:predicted nucleic acid-binding protein
MVCTEVTDRALSLRDDYLNGKLILACPDLLTYEVINALRFKPGFGVEDLKDVADAIRKYNLLTCPILDNTLVERTVGFAVKYGITIYDGSYLALEEYLDSAVYTTDWLLKWQTISLLPAFQITSRINLAVAQNRTILSSYALILSNKPKVSGGVRVKDRKSLREAL